MFDSIYMWYPDSDHMTLQYDSSFRKLQNGGAYLLMAPNRSFLTSHVATRMATVVLQAHLKDYLFYPSRLFLVKD